MVIIGLFTVCSAYVRADQKVVVINPGHSVGYDSGASGTLKSEAQINQEVAGKVVNNLMAKGYKVYITHTTDPSLAPYKLLDNSTASHLAPIGEAINNIHPDLAMAIHHNSGGTQSTGYELYWSSYRSFDGEGVYSVPNMWSGGGSAYRDASPCAVASASRDFAEVVRRHMEGIPRLSYRNTFERDDYLPAHVNAPCILYEGGFLSNPSEADYLASEEYQVEAARRIAEAIDEYLGGSGMVADDQPPTIDNVYVSATETTSTDYSIECHASDNLQLSRVSFATWTESGGQDDIVWQNGLDNGGGNYSAIINAKDHNFEVGKYITHIYAYDLAGNFVGVAAPDVTVKPVSGLETGLSVEKLTSNLAVAYANNLGGNGYRFAVWSAENGQDDIVWTDGELQIGNCYRSVIDRSDHGGDDGTYFVHCYTSNTNQFVGANDVDFGTLSYDRLASTSNGNTIHTELTGLNSPDGINKVNIAVWSDVDGQDDLKWYDMTPNGGNNYVSDVDVSSHAGSGTFWIHAYLCDNYGNMQFIGATAAVVNKGNTPSAPSNNGSGNVSISGVSGSSFRVAASGITDNCNVYFAVWSSANGQDDLVWHLATSAGGGNFVADIDLNVHKDTGVYDVHMYKQIGDQMVFMGAYTTNVTQLPSNTGYGADTPIMGVSPVTAAQLVNLYNSQSPIKFPDYYVARGVSLGQFAQCYIDECAVEGVRADVAFAQAMLETGYLKFGGDVSINQFNFAGLGATGNGVKGEDFAAKYGDSGLGIQMGIRAQIQHLKAYASTEPLKNECVDSRFNLVSRGRATTIGGLTGTWAASTTYADSIVRILRLI